MNVHQHEPRKNTSSRILVFSYYTSCEYMRNTRSAGKRTSPRIIMWGYFVSFLYSKIYIPRERERERERERSTGWLEILPFLPLSFVFISGGLYRLLIIPPKLKYFRMLSREAPRWKRVFCFFLLPYLRYNIISLLPLSFLIQGPLQSIENILLLYPGSAMMVRNFFSFFFLFSTSRRLWSQL